MKQNGKIKENAGPVDKLISVITYIVFALFSLICIYPFYYIFINTISANDLSEKGKIIFWPQQIHFRNYLDATKIPGLLQAAQISIARTRNGMYGIVSRLPRLYVHKRNHVETETLVPVRSIDYVF